MENIYYELRFRGYSVGVGVVEKVEKGNDYYRVDNGRDRRYT